MFTNSHLQKTVEEIVNRFNSGDVAGAKRLLLLSSMALPENTKKFLQEKMQMNLSGYSKKQKIPKIVMYAFEQLQGVSISDENGIVIYQR